jgi:aminomethyltransferase
VGSKYTSLLEDHRKLGARLIDFAGWDMPLQYEGVVAEHNAVRNDVGVFDVSHLGKLVMSGPDAIGTLQAAVTADVEALAPGTAKYALCLTDDAGCIDDIFVYRLSERDVLVVPNAANVDAVADAIRSAGPAEVVDAWDRWAILAIQGPRSFEVAEKLWPDAGMSEMKLYSWQTINVFGEPGMIARTGYTGEPGFELYAPTGTSSKAFTALMEAGVTPVGLGARDTLRLEMGYALYGHELTLDINPLEAGLGWAISWDAPFRGRDALAKVKEEGPARRLFGITCTDRGVPRQHYSVMLDDEPIAEVTSGNFSPTLQTGIALALGPADKRPAEGQKVAIDARGRPIAGDIVKPPFIDRGKKRSTS